jgi:hypothetical protein
MRVRAWEVAYRKFFATRPRRLFIGMTARIAACPVGCTGYLLRSLATVRMGR